MSNEKPMTDIRELLTAIRAWQAANAAYEEARKTLTGGAWVNKHTIEACAYLDECSMAINGKFHEGRTLAAFVALADHVDAQAAALDVLCTRIARIGDECLHLFMPTMTIEWTLDAIEERLKIDAALTSEPTASDEGDA